MPKVKLQVSSTLGRNESLARRREIRLDLGKDHDRDHRILLPYDAETTVGTVKWVVSQSQLRHTYQSRERRNCMNAQALDLQEKNDVTRTAN